MYKTFVLLAALVVLVGLACTLTDNIPSSADSLAAITQAAPTQAATQAAAQLPTPTNQPTQAAPTQAAKVCIVETGIIAGSLTVRACGAVDCAPVAWLVQGETITPTHPTTGAAWLEVKAGELQGWVYSKFINCEVKP